MTPADDQDRQPMTTNCFVYYGRGSSKGHQAVIRPSHLILLHGSPWKINVRLTSGRG